MFVSRAGNIRQQRPKAEQDHLDGGCPPPGVCRQPVEEKLDTIPNLVLTQTQVSDQCDPAHAIYRVCRAPARQFVRDVACNCAQGIIANVDNY